MSDMVFCYSCRVHHPRDQMLGFATRSGTRWRCRRSIVEASGPLAERDAFGRRQSEINRELTRKKVDRFGPAQLERLLRR